jgi:DNA-binding CsgD family transcriptional regulator
MDTRPPDPVAILRKRRPSAIAVLGPDMDLQWLNGEAAPLLVGAHPETPGPLWLQSAALARRLLAGSGGPLAQEASAADTPDGPVYGLRASFLTPPPGGAAKPPLVLIQIDIVAMEREVDFDAVRRRYGISRREQDVLRMLYFGKSNREIAELLFISEYTVKDHIKAIMAKMDAGSRAEVVYKLTTAA